jgi:hypothetical protein
MQRKSNQYAGRKKKSYYEFKFDIDFKSVKRFRPDLKPGCTSDVEPTYQMSISVLYVMLAGKGLTFCNFNFCSYA